ncbi:MAG: O-antigen polymerase [Lactobacillus helveticus]
MSIFLTLIVLEIIIVIINLQLFKHDIFSPATISSIMFLIATLFALYCATYWNLILSSLTVQVIVVGLLFMTIGEFLGDKLGTIFTVKSPIKKTTLIVVSKKVKVSVTICVVIMTILYAVNAYHVGLLNGGTGANAFAYMKSAYASNSSTRMNPIIRQGFKFIMASAYIACFILANNYLILKQRLKENMTYVIIIVCSIAVTIFSGSRTEILRVISALFLDYSILLQINNKKKTIRSGLIIKKILPVVLIIILIAFLSRQVVKVTGTATSQGSSLIYYLAFYVGSPIAVLNNKISMAFSKENIFIGATTGVPNFVYLGNLDYGGNVGTILQPSLFKYGLIGMAIFILIIYFWGGLLYSRIKCSLQAGHSLFILLFSSWYYMFTMSYYDDIISALSFVITILLIDAVLMIIYPLFFKKAS